MTRVGNPANLAVEDLVDVCMDAEDVVDDDGFVDDEDDDEEEEEELVVGCHVDLG